MKKALTRTTIVFVALNLITAGFAFAQNAPDEASRKEAIAARKQAEVAQTQVKIFPSTIPDVTIAAPRQFQIQGLPWQHSSGGAVLVIPVAQMKIENLAAITEDMTVMSRIFDKKLSQARLTTGGSWPTIGFESTLFGRSRSSGAIEAIYLEGYGALFLMKVNVLLSPPPETQQEKETEEEDTDPLWTQMRQEMYAPQDTRRRRGERPEEKYDAEKVEDLKETLIKTLKHAANIRALKPDESVILTVIGKAGQPATSAFFERLDYGRLNKEAGSSYILSTAPRARTGFSSPAVLTIRAKKADIDAFANGTLSFDQFNEKTLLLSYSYLSEDFGTRSSPWRDESISVGPSRSSSNLGMSGRRPGSSSSRRSRR